MRHGLTLWFLLMGTLVTSPGYAEETEAVSMDTKVENDSAVRDPTLEDVQQICPSQKEVRNECGKESVSAEKLFSEDNAVSPTRKKYSAVNRCKLWWWAQHVQDWQYAPLIEWTNLMQDALVEGLTSEQTFDILGLAPVPPTTKLNTDGRPESTCVRGRPQDSKRLSDRFKNLNLKDLNAGTLRDLVSHCLAFELETAVWKRIITKVVGTYIIPLGNVNLVVLGRPRLHLDMDREVSDEDQDNGDVIYTTVGSCPVSKDPRECAEGFFKDSQFKYGFSSGKKFKMKGTSFKTDVDTLYGGGSLSRIYDVNLILTEEGKINFQTSTDGSQMYDTPVLIDNAGMLTLNTAQQVCDPSSDGGVRLTIKPLAFGDEFRSLVKELAYYTPSDFPAPSARMIRSGVEKGCKSGKTYSEWAADAANGARHFAHHGWPIDTVYRTIAQLRYRWELDGQDTPSIKENLTFGLWRKQVEETPMLQFSPLQRQAIVFALGKNGNSSDRGISFRTIAIDDRRATEVWYYQKPISFWPLHSEKKGHVLIIHLDNFNDIYANSVIARLVGISTTCGTIRDQKEAFLRSMFALFNARPLQKGNEIVNRVFMASMYQYLFGKKLKRVGSYENIDMDAMTMSFNDFSEKYLNDL